MAFNAPLTYKGRPLVRCKSEIYYGDPEQSAVVFMQVLSTREESGETVADRVHMMLLSTDVSLSPKDRILKQSDKNGLYNALDFASILLDRQLGKAK